jgi:hypothetical protein
MIHSHTDFEVMGGYISPVSDVSFRSFMTGQYLTWDFAGLQEARSSKFNAQVCVISLY